MSDNQNKVRLRVSGSSAPLAINCSHWVGKEVIEEAMNEFAAEGTRLHALAECLITGEVSASELTDASDKAVARTVAELMAKPGFQMVAVEQAFAFDANTHTIREIETDGHRDYGELSSTEVPFTVDLIYEAEGKLFVRDWKFGPKGTQNYKAECNAQLILGAAGAAHMRKLAITDIYVEFADQTGVVDQWKVTKAAFYDMANRLMLALNTSQPANPGGHCTYCKFKMDCQPGVNAMFAPIEKLAEPRVQLTYNIRDEAHAAAMLIALSYVEREADRLKKHIREYAETHRIVDKDGRVYQCREYSQPSYSIQAARFSDAELDEFVRQGRATKNETRTRWGFYKDKVHS